MDEESAPPTEERKQRTLTATRLEIRASEAETLAANIVLFLEEFLEEQFHQGLGDLIQDGVILCRCVQKLEEHNTKFKFHAKPKQAFHMKENLDSFVAYCEKHGMKRKFDVKAVLNKEDISTAVHFLCDFAKYVAKEGKVKHQPWMNEAASHNPHRSVSTKSDASTSSFLSAAMPFIQQSAQAQAQAQAKPKPKSGNPVTMISPRQSRPLSTASSSSHISYSSTSDQSQGHTSHESSSAVQESTFIPIDLPPPPPFNPNETNEPGSVSSGAGGTSGKKLQATLSLASMSSNTQEHPDTPTKSKGFNLFNKFRISLGGKQSKKDEDEAESPRNESMNAELTEPHTETSASSASLPSPPPPPPPPRKVQSPPKPPLEPPVDEAADSDGQSASSRSSAERVIGSFNISDLNDPNASNVADSSEEDDDDSVYYPESATHSTRSSWIDHGSRPTSLSPGNHMSELRLMIERKLKDQEARKVAEHESGTDGAVQAETREFPLPPILRDRPHESETASAAEEVIGGSGGHHMARNRVSSVIIHEPEKILETEATAHEDAEKSDTPASPPPAVVSNQASDDRREFQREKVLEELLLTEADYLRDLNIIVDVFLTPLSGTNILTPSQINEIFPGIKSLYDLHVIIKDEFKKDKNGVGKTLVKYGAALKMYSSYCAAYDNILVAITKLRQSNSGFKKFLKTALQNELCRGLDLTSFLIKPVQRICKYPLLLKELLKNTTETHEDYKNIDDALQIVNKCAAGVNQKVKEMKNNERLLSINSRLEGSKENLLTPTRKFIMEAPVRRYSTSQGFQQRRIILFNDMILLVKDIKQHSYKWKDNLPLQQNHAVQEYKDDRLDCGEFCYGFEIIQKSKASVREAYNSKMILFATSAAERAEIMQQIHSLISEMSKKNDVGGMKEWKKKSLRYNTSGGASEPGTRRGSVSSTVSDASVDSIATSMLQEASSYSVSSLTRRSGRTAGQQLNYRQSIGADSTISSTAPDDAAHTNLDDVNFSDTLVETAGVNPETPSQS